MLSTRLTGFVFSVFLLAGCASTATQSEFDTTHYTDRLQTHTDGGLRISTSTLSDREAEAVYGVPLAEKGIQPVWIEVENQDDIAYWLLSPGLDPDFFPASEAADIFAGSDTRSNRELNRHFGQLAFKNPVVPGATVSGYILTNHDEAVKMVELDLVASGHLKSYSTITPVPGFRGDYKESKAFSLDRYPAEEIINYTDEAAFRAALEALPCCATNKKGTRNCDPLNLVIVGGLEDAFPALVRRGWHPTESTYAGSVKKMIDSVLSGEPALPVWPFAGPGPAEGPR